MKNHLTKKTGKNKIREGEGDREGGRERESTNNLMMTPICSYYQNRNGSWECLTVIGNVTETLAMTPPMINYVGKITNKKCAPDCTQC